MSQNIEMLKNNIQYFELQIWDLPFAITKLFLKLNMLQIILENMNV